MVGRGIDHNRKGGAFEIEQPKVGPEGELSGGERVKGHGKHGGKNRYSVAFSIKISGYALDSTDYNM